MGRTTVPGQARLRGEGPAHNRASSDAPDARRGDRHAPGQTSSHQGLLLGAREHPLQALQARLGHEAQGPEVVEPALAGAHLGEPDIEEVARHPVRREAGIVRHVGVARSDRGPVPEQHVDGGDRPGRRRVDRRFRLALEDQRRDRVQVRAGDQRKAIRLEHPGDLAKGGQHLVGMQMLEIMRRPDRVEAGVTHEAAHVRDRADEVGRDPRVDVEAHLGPAQGAEHRVQLHRVERPAAGVEHAPLASGLR